MHFHCLLHAKKGSEGIQIACKSADLYMLLTLPNRPSAPPTYQIKGHTYDIKYTKHNIVSIRHASRLILKLAQR